MSTLVTTVHAMLVGLAFIGLLLAFVTLRTGWLDVLGWVLVSLLSLGGAFGVSVLRDRWTMATARPSGRLDAVDTPVDARRVQPR